MTNEKVGDGSRLEPERRRLLGGLAGLGVLGLALPWALRREEKRPRVLSLKEADFYRPHDLAG